MSGWLPAGCRPGARCHRGGDPAAERRSMREDRVSTFAGRLLLNRPNEAGVYSVHIGCRRIKVRVRALGLAARQR
jgi:hypothetical protein